MRKTRFLRFKCPMVGEEANDGSATSDGQDAQNEKSQVSTDSQPGVCPHRTSFDLGLICGQPGPTQPLSSKATAATETKLSKNQLKKKMKWERKMEVKKRKKNQEKEAKIAKARAQGRNLEEERRLVLERTRLGEGNKRRQTIWETTKLPLAKSSFQVCLDCSFESYMTAKEINSLASQIRLCYSNNRWSPHPCLLTVTSLMGATRGHLQKVDGFEDWNKRAFIATELPLEEHFQADLDKVVYLTSDSPNTLKDLDDSKIYVVGGIVDRNRLKRATITKAEKIGVATAKLPIEEHLRKMESTRVLTCNHVFDIMLKYRELGRDWKKALISVLPDRKGAQLQDDDQDDDDAAVERRENT